MPPEKSGAIATATATSAVLDDPSKKTSNTDNANVPKIDADADAKVKAKVKAIPPVQSNEKTVVGGTGIYGEAVPGWTIMRPLKMRGLKKGAGRNNIKMGTGTGTSGGVDGKGEVDGNGNGNADRKGNGNGDFKITETNGSGDADRDGDGDGEGGVGDMDILSEVRSDDELLGEEEDELQRQRVPNSNGGANTGLDGTVEREEEDVVEYKVYKRRWFGLVQLVLLNIVVSWDWLTFAANSTTVSEYFDTTESNINWLSTGFLFAFVVASPLVVFTLHRGGPRPSIVIASVLLLLGNWIRYGATRSGANGNFGGVMFGQILTGLAQPFVLAAPTRYSDLWFTNRGRVAATAVMSLANPFGGALAQLIDPVWADKARDVPDMVLYIAIMATIASVPSFFIPSHPPTPSSASGHEAKQPLLPSLRFLFYSPEFYMIMIPFTFYVGLFNSISSLINQMLEPYSFSETDAGIAGGILIVVGLVTSAIISPIIDRTKSYLIAIKVQVPIIALCYLAFTWAPQTRSLGAVYTILAILGAASFSLMPVVLEYMIEITHPVSPEVTSTICWSGGQLLGGIFIVVSDALRNGGEDDGTADDGTRYPPGNMYRALIFQTVMALVVVPLPLMLGMFGRGHGVRMRRIEADSNRVARRDEGVVLP
ncbi:Solute carrier family 49 member A3 [Lachnellula subtilissima]|uniref:Solute carrier family 49 member A3 n=1 Tax=Lachnellula subtilissima TaxID=602034 RepID=A0A8H8RJE3_9HELO|nr:Solute carrier family 49 member A3 [Lachnellula subtilissima]